MYSKWYSTLNEITGGVCFILKLILLHLQPRVCVGNAKQLMSWSHYCSIKATHIYFTFYKRNHSTRFYLVICKIWKKIDVFSFKRICNFLNINIEPTEILQWWVCGATNGLDASHMFYVSYSNLLGKDKVTKIFFLCTYSNVASHH